MKSYYTSENEIQAMRKELEHAHEFVVKEADSYKKRKLIRYLSSGLSFIIIGLLIYILVVVNIARSKQEVPTVFGYQIYEIQSGSMDPTLQVNALILSKQVDEKDILKIGDVITFVQNDVTITHRIVDVIDDFGSIKYQTKGDNANNSIDPDLVEPSQVKAKFITKLPFYVSTHEDTSGGEKNE